MNKVITINLNGVAYQLEEGGFDALRAYLDTAGRRLEGNPDKDEILGDIEQAIGDKFRSLLNASKTVVVTQEVADIIAAALTAPVGNLDPVLQATLRARARILAQRHPLYRGLGAAG